MERFISFMHFTEFKSKKFLNKLLSIEKKAYLDSPLCDTIYEKGFAVRKSSYELENNPLSIIKLATSYTFGYGTEKSNTKTQELLEEVFNRYSEEELEKYDKNEIYWAYNQLSYLYFIQKDYSKAFNLVKNKLGKNPVKIKGF